MRGQGIQERRPGRWDATNPPPDAGISIAASGKTTVIRAALPKGEPSAGKVSASDSIGLSPNAEKS
jgi:hypothetical protein